MEGLAFLCLQQMEAWWLGYNDKGEEEEQSQVGLHAEEEVVQEEEDGSYMVAADQ